MENKFKILIAGGVILFACLVVWVVNTTPAEPPPVEKVAPPSKMEYEGNTIVEEKDGVKLLELYSDKMIVDAKTQNAEFENIHGKLYQADGKFVELKAKKGNYNRKNESVHVEGDVIVTDSEGAKLISGKLDWNSKDDMLVATEKVKLSKDDMRATGDRAEATNGLRHFKLKGNAQVLRGVKESEGK